MQLDQLELVKPEEFIKFADEYSYQEWAIQYLKKPSAYSVIATPDRLAIGMVQHDERYSSGFIINGKFGTGKSYTFDGYKLARGIQEEIQKTVIYVLSRNIISLWHAIKHPPPPEELPDTMICKGGPADGEEVNFEGRTYIYFPHGSGQSVGFEPNPAPLKPEPRHCYVYQDGYYQYVGVE